MRQALEQYTREELRGLALEALVLLPVGAIEQHGPHLPVGVDTYTVTHIAQAARTEIGARYMALIVQEVARALAEFYHRAQQE